jgi:hypothetical protein
MPFISFRNYNCRLYVSKYQSEVVTSCPGEEYEIYIHGMKIIKKISGPERDEMGST